MTLSWTIRRKFNEFSKIPFLYPILFPNLQSKAASEHSGWQPDFVRTNSYVLSTVSNRESKLNLTSAQDIHIIMESTLYHLCGNAGIQVGLRLVNLRFTAPPNGVSQDTGDPRFVLDLSFCHNLSHIPHICGRDSSREMIGLDQIRPLAAPSAFVLNGLEQRFTWPTLEDIGPSYK